MGHVTSYPASLRQLDLSHNEITCWPSLPSRLTTQDPHLVCYNIATSSSSNSPSEDVDDGIAAAASVHHENRSNSLRNAVLKSVCIHRKHLRLESLRTLILADNLLTRIQLTTDDVTFTDDEEHDWSVVGVTKLRLMFPNLSMLDISNNCLKEIPQSLYELSNLSVLNISGNIDITDLPPNMGLLSRLWNLNTRGCSLQGPLRSMIENGKYKTMDIIGYLKSVYEDARPYARMKLMVVGAQGIGKTSLLELLRQESTVRSKRSSADHWTKRIGGGGGGGASPVGSLTSSGGTGKEANISTVGVDIGDWICEKRIRGQSQHGPVVFRTWDFGGQKEYNSVKIRKIGFTIFFLYCFTDTTQHISISCPNVVCTLLCGELWTAKMGWPKCFSGWPTFRHGHQIHRSSLWAPIRIKSARPLARRPRRKCNKSFGTVSLP